MKLTNNFLILFESTLSLRASWMLYKVFTISTVAQLTVPVLPIIISCVLSIYCVQQSRKISKLSRAVTCMRPKENGTNGGPENGGPANGGPANGGTRWRAVLKKTKRSLSTVSESGMVDKQKQATITILIVTAIYIACNVPVFVSYNLFLLDMFVLDAPRFAMTPFMNFYGWNIVYTLLVAVNAAANPLVYWTRIQKMRRFYSADRICEWVKSSVYHVGVKLGLKQKKAKYNGKRKGTYSEIYSEM